MGRRIWHVIEDGDAIIHARRWPMRFDLAVETALPHGSRHRVARQVRQDIWRALQRLRGFAPAVRVEPSAGGGLRVIAGGEVEGRFARGHVEAAIASVLGNRANRSRWVGRSN